MNKQLTLLIALIAWVAIVPPTRAQFNCALVGNHFGKNSFGYDALACVGSNCIVRIGYHDYIRFLRSFDGGYTWVQDDPGVPIDTFEGIYGIDMIDSSNIVAYGVSGHSPYGLIIRTSDGGVTWMQETVPSEDQINGLSFSNAMNGMLVVAGDGTFLTTDGGNHWDTIPVLRGPQYQGWECHDYDNGIYRVFRHYTGEIYTIVNKGRSFDSTPPIVSDSNRRSGYRFDFCTFGLGDTLFAYGYHGATPCIARTSDGGHNWSIVYDDTAGIAGEAVSFSDVNRDTIVAAISGGPDDVLWSKDNGVTWEIDSLICTDTNFDGYQNDGIGLNSEGDLVGAFNSFALVGQIVKTSLVIGKHVTSGIIPNEVKSPSEKLFPNPATTSLTLTGVDAGSTVHLLDILGREVLTDKVPASGVLTLDVSRLPRGIYAAMVEMDGQMLPLGRIVLVGE